MYRPVRTPTASTTFMNGPAARMISRCQRGLMNIARGSFRGILLRDNRFDYPVGGPLVGDPRERVADKILARLLARHLDVAAEKKQGEPVVRFAALEPEKPRAETKTENFHLDVEEARGPEVPQFVDQDHDPDQDQQPPDIRKERKCHRDVFSECVLNFHRL